jgi:hypothetical protein
MLVATFIAAVVLGEDVVARFTVAAPLKLSVPIDSVAPVAALLVSVLAALESTFRVLYVPLPETDPLITCTVFVNAPLPETVPLLTTTGILTAVLLFWIRLPSVGAVVPTLICVLVLMLPAETAPVATSRSRVLAATAVPVIVVVPV